MRSSGTPTPIPAGLDQFEIAGGGTCHTDGRTYYLDIDGSVVVIGKPGLAAVEAWINGPLALDAPALTRLVTYALAGALRRRRRFELHSGALIHPDSGAGLLVIGPSGSGKSTLSVHLAAAGWPFLTDDVLLLGHGDSEINAWPLRRCFAITSETFAASRFLREHTTLGDTNAPGAGKTPFVPHAVFPGGFTDHCTPRTLFFSELTGDAHSCVSPLSPGDTMARLIRMSPWSCYDRPTAADHLDVLSSLVRQSTGFRLRAGTDLLDPEASAKLCASYACG
jgi:hypothetical protein